MFPALRGNALIRPFGAPSPGGQKGSRQPQALRERAIDEALPTLALRERVAEGRVRRFFAS